AHVHRASNTPVAVDLHAGDALKRIRDGHVGQRADALRRNAVLDTWSQTLHFNGFYLRLTYAVDGDYRLLRLLGTTGPGLRFFGIGRCALLHRALRRRDRAPSRGEGIPRGDTREICGHD